MDSHEWRSVKDIKEKGLRHPIAALPFQFVRRFQTAFIEYIAPSPAKQAGISTTRMFGSLEHLNLDIV